MEEYKQWLNKAEDDLLWTKNSLNGKIWYGACFSAQQAAEKALKGYLISYEKPLRKIHAYEEIDKYTQEQAHEAYEHAAKVVEFVKSKLK